MHYDIQKSGKRVKDLRRRKGFTQETFADAVGLSYRSIADIERGYRGTSIDALIEMSRVLKTTLDYLILGNSIIEKEIEFSEAEIFIISLLAGQSEQHKILAGKILKGILENILD
ncbi:helix-turn-helix domain-containing protein [Lachnotalea glycerini]|uniref:XRE family transcriptional regulator n=1 Tax=Lachnotalea glycerini TaxID=1763509 RepID=A0A371J3X5_9FIRM|nr:helix-turn-helix transcriptional regulator [Lachnotalea glycerini]RDY27491.1 XRE family transcriptional regulator [Lachnotalea glycerini]